MRGARHRARDTQAVMVTKIEPRPSGHGILLIKLLAICFFFLVKPVRVKFGETRDGYVRDDTETNETQSFLIIFFFQFIDIPRRGITIRDGFLCLTEP